MRRNYLGDRGESQNDIEQTENELVGANDLDMGDEENKEQEQTNNDDEPPPLEDIDDIEMEQEKEQENEVIEPVVETVTTEKPKEDDVGRFLFLEMSIHLNFDFSDIPFIRPPLQNVISRPSSDTIFGGSQSILNLFSICTDL